MLASNKLTDEERARIIDLVVGQGWRPRDAAREVGVPSKHLTLVVSVYRRFGWACPIAVVTCTECGELMVASGQYPRTAHERCRPARHARKERERMAAGKKPKEPGLTKLLAWGKAHPERMKEVERRANAEKREARKLEPAETHAARFEALAEHDRESWRRTRQAATRAGDRWTPDEDAALIAHGLHLYQLAFELGRTLYAVRVRLQRLRTAAAKSGCTLEEFIAQRMELQRDERRHAGDHGIGERHVRV